MKTLKRFWEWCDAEKPDAETEEAMFLKNVSDVGNEATWRAREIIRERSGCHDTEVHRFHGEALRDLSLALCEPLERMHEQVPEGPGRPVEEGADDPRDGLRESSLPDWSPPDGVAVRRDPESDTFIVDAATATHGDWEKLRGCRENVRVIGCPPVGVEYYARRCILAPMMIDGAIVEHHDWPWP